MRFLIKIITPVILCAGLFSCGKDDPAPTPEKYVYDLTGTKNFNVASSSIDSMIISLKRVSGSTEKIALSMTGLPQNMTATFKPTSEGLPPYTATVVLSGTNMPEGTYNAVLVASGITSGNIEHPVTITVFKEDIACVAPLIGGYSVSEDCETAPPPYSATISIDPANNKGVLIKGFASIDLTVKAAVVCGSSTIVIPEQTVGNNTVSGNGTFSGNKLKINYNLTVKNPGSTTFTTSCTSNYLKK